MAYSSALKSSGGNTKKKNHETLRHDRGKNSITTTFFSARKKPKTNVQSANFTERFALSCNGALFNDVRARDERGHGVSLCVRRGCRA